TRSLIDIRHIDQTCRSAVTCSEYSRFQRILYQCYPRALAMQRRKIAIACLSLLLVGLALPSTSIPRAHAFHTGTITVTLGNVLLGATDPLTLGTVTAAQASSTVSVNIVIQASNIVYQRNVTLGLKADGIGNNKKLGR